MSYRAGQVIGDYYEAVVYCRNCGYGSPDGIRQQFLLGLPVSEHACPRCGCTGLALRTGKADNVQDGESHRAVHSYKERRE